MNWEDRVSEPRSRLNMQQNPADGERHVRDVEKLRSLKFSAG